MKWSVYIVRCRDGALYTGIATDVLRRLEQHARPGGRGAKSLRGRGPLSLVARRIVGSRSLAQSVESRIKALSRPRKLWLIAKPSRLDRLVASAARASRSAAGRVDRTKPISQSQLGRSKRVVPRLNHDMC